MFAYKYKQLSDSVFVFYFFLVTPVRSSCIGAIGLASSTLVFFFSDNDARYLRRSFPHSCRLPLHGKLLHGAGFQ